MTAAAAIRALADELAEVLLRGDPFGASFMAISGYDDDVLTCHRSISGPGAAGFVDIIARCAGCEADHGDIGSHVLLETVRRHGGP